MWGCSSILPRKSKLEIGQTILTLSTPFIQHSECKGTPSLMEPFLFLIADSGKIHMSKKTFDRQCKFNKSQEKKKVCKTCISQWRHILVNHSNHIRSTLPDLLLWTSSTQLGWVSFSVFQSTIFSLWSKPPSQTQRNCSLQKNFSNTCTLGNVPNRTEKQVTHYQLCSWGLGFYPVWFKEGALVSNTAMTSQNSFQCILGFNSMSN